MSRECPEAGDQIEICSAGQGVISLVGGNSWTLVKGEVLEVADVGDNGENFSFLSIHPPRAGVAYDCNDPCFRTEYWHKWIDGTWGKYREHISKQCISSVPSALTNNDGRSACAWCGAETKKVQSIMSTFDICTKCGK